MEKNLIRVSCEPICSNCKFAMKIEHKKERSTSYECHKFEGRIPIRVLGHFKCSHNGFYPRLSWLQSLWIKFAKHLFTLR